MEESIYDTKEMLKDLETLAYYNQFVIKDDKLKKEDKELRKLIKALKKKKYKGVIRESCLEEVISDDED